MCTILLGYIVEKMGADPSGKFDKDWRRINLVAVPPVPLSTPQYPPVPLKYPPVPRLPPSRPRTGVGGRQYTPPPHIFLKLLYAQDIGGIWFKKRFCTKGHEKTKKF